MLRAAFLRSRLPLALLVLLSACGESPGADPTSSASESTGASTAPSAAEATPEPRAGNDSVAFAVEVGNQTVRVDAATGQLSNIIRLPQAVMTDPFAVAYHTYSISPDGRMLAVQCDDAGAPMPYKPNMNLCVFIDDTALGRVLVSRHDLTPGESIGRAYIYGDPFAFSPDGRWIVFYTDSAAYVADTGTGTPRRVFEATIGVGMSNAVWSSDGKRFVMRHTSENDQSRDLVAIDAATGATTDVVRVDDAVGVKSFVAWAPDNERLAFLGFDAGDSALPTPLRLYVARVDGSGVAEVATGGREPYGGSSLSWSPDGRWIAANLIEQVTSQAGTETRAYAIGVTGSDLLPLGGTSLHPNSYDVAWSPDSGSVASLGSEQGRYVVAFAPLDGVAPAAADIGSSYSGPLTAYIEFVVWNPSGGRLFYALRSCGQGGCGNSEVYMVDATLTDAQPITNGGARFLGFVP